MRKLFAVFAGVVVFGVMPLCAEASPFVINLLASAPSGGKPDSFAGGDSSVFGLGGSTSTPDTANLTLNATRPASNSRVAPTEVASVDVSRPGGASGLTAALVSSANVAVNVPEIAHLNLGNGEYVTVAGAVAPIIASSGLSTGSVLNPVDQVTDTSITKNVVLIDAVIPDVAKGIILPPSGLSASGKDEQPPNADPVPEPATLLLLGSGLAVAARRRTRRQGQ